MYIEKEERYISILVELADSIEKRGRNHCNALYNSVVNMINDDFSSADLVNILESLCMGEDFIFNNKSMFYDDFIDYLTTKSTTEQQEILILIRSFWAQFFHWEVNNHYCLIKLVMKGC